MRGLACLTAVLVGLLIIGCTQTREEIKPIELGKAIDISKTQYKEIDLKKANEIDLVEELHQVRADYRRLLEVMREWYLQKGYFEKAKWAGTELKDLLAIRTYNYLFPIEVLEVPAESASAEIVEANELYKQARKLQDEGEILPLINNKPKLKQALDRYREVVKGYPTSTVAPDAAFFAAEILKEHFQENIQAIEYYKIALKLNPQIKRQVRFQMAVIYDFRLHDRSEALKMYRRVLDEEPDIDKTNTAFAATRIEQLLKEKEAETSLETRPTQAAE